jgi:hypothetical protein
MMEATFDEKKLEEIYERVVEEPNRDTCKKGFIKCPECGEEILLIPTLRVMNSAIENHVRKHKEALKGNPVEEHRVAIMIRLGLVGQVLQQACKIQVS